MAGNPEIIHDKYFTSCLSVSGFDNCKKLGLSGEAGPLC